MKGNLKLLFMYMLSLSVFISGCGIGSSEEAENGKTIPLTFWTFQELHKQFFDDAVISWNEDNADQQIELETEVYSYDEMHDKLLISLQSGFGAPDIADIEISRFANYLKNKIPPLVPLNQYINSEIENCIQTRFDNYSKNGNYYGIDYHAGATVMYYNKRILNKAGLDPKSIKTWDDYVEAGKIVVAKTGIPMTTVEVSEHWILYSLINQIGSDIFDKRGNITLDNDDNKRVLQFLYDMVHKDKIAIPAPGGFHHSEEYYVFMNNDGAASLIMPIWYMGRFLEYMPDLKGDIIILPLPAWEEGGYRSAGMGGTGTVVTAQSENQELSAGFLAYAKVSKEGAIKTWTMLGFDPIRWDVWDMPEMNRDNKYTDYFGNGIFEMLKGIKDEINPINVPELFPAAIELLKKDVSFKTIEEQSLTPAQALTEAAVELRERRND